MTREEYDKLKDCQVVDMGNTYNRKFVRRGRQSAKLASMDSAGTITVCSYMIGKVYIDGKRLEYKSKHTFTNPNNPF